MPPSPATNQYPWLATTCAWIVTWTELEGVLVSPPAVCVAVSVWVPIARLRAAEKLPEPSAIVVAMRLGPSPMATEPFGRADPPTVTSALVVVVPSGGDVIAGGAGTTVMWTELDRKSTRLNSSHAN